MNLHREGGDDVNKLWELLGTSVLIQAAITLALLITICYMYIVGTEVPDPLWNAFMVILGFYFGSKVQNQIQRRQL